MFENIKKYCEGSHSHNTEIIANQVVLYPENKLPDLVVTSEFGDCTVITSDLYDLFNQQRIANLGADVVRDFIARNYPATSLISDHISKMSDADIMDSIKPRYIQSYSELMQWSKYLEMRIENGLKSLEREPTPEPTPDLTVEPSPERDSKTE